MFGNDNNQDQNDDMHPNNTGPIIMPTPDATLDASSHSQSEDNQVPSAPDVAGVADSTDEAPVNDNSTPAPAPAPASGSDDDLLELKQQALQELSPLVNHLEQTPEEKFKTTMMMIQAADNKGLVKTAYEAAKQITDEKARAQALLDVINEINYFTHNSDGEDQINP